MSQDLKKLYKKKNWWQKANWSKIEYDVRKLQEEISKASKMRDSKKLKNLMKSLVKSESAKLLAIYYITHKNKGKYTAGIDGKKYLTLKAKMDLINEKFNYKKYKFKPVVIKEIPKKKETQEIRKGQSTKIDKSNKYKTRSIGIMTLKDRIMAKIISFALMAKWEPLLESNVMGYRSGKSVQDCIYKISIELIKGDKIILDADIKNFFGTIKHKAILDKIKVFRKIIKRILKIKTYEKNKYRKNKKGIVQGNPISPLLSNIALHGMQELFETQLVDGKYIRPKSKVFVIRYADDFIVIAPSKKILENWVMPQLNEFLKKRDLSFNLEKTKITTKNEGFKFLGYYIKQQGNKLVVRPEKKSSIYKKYNDLYISN